MNAERSTDVDTRMAIMDAAKGIGILLVIVGHALGGIIDSDLDAGGIVVRYCFLFIYTFHMPLFFVLAGIFVRGRMEKGSRDFTTKIAYRLVYPYFLWSIAQVLVVWLLNSLVNAPPTNVGSMILLSWWFPIAQFWFLQTLVLSHLLALVTVRMGGLVAAVIAGLFGVILAITIPLPVPLLYLAHFYPYYLLGVCAGPLGLQRLCEAFRERNVVRCVVVLAIAGCLLTSWRLATGYGAGFVSEPNHLRATDIAQLGWSANAGTQLLATAAILAIATHLRGRALALAMALGVASFPIYVLHVFFVAGVRILLHKILRVDSVALIVSVSIVAGLIGPFWIFAWLKARRLNRAFGLN